MVCNGHYRIPRYPNTAGIARWLNSGRASHSAWYRHPRNLGDTVLVVGAGPSRQDISAEMRSAARTVIHSVSGAVAEEIGRVTRFRENCEATFEDGTTESGISHRILASGYEVSFPCFDEDTLHSEIPPPAPPLPREVYNSTYSVFPLARHLFPLQNAFPLNSLVFLGLLVRVPPFPVVEAHAHAALRPVQEAVDIMTQYEELRRKVGDSPLAIAAAWH
ncbi:hypothetical protein FPV67DRAFT_1380496, partial [Lyophyllum atratum]